MSRREDVEKDIVWIESGGLDAECEQWPDPARTLADEVDALRGQLLALGKKATRYENEREINAGLVVERDAVITRLLAMLEPGEKPKEPYPSVTSYEHQLASIKRKLWIQREQLYARACEIAGRKE